MMFQNLKSFVVKIHLIDGILFLLLFLVSMTGCSTYTSIEKSTKKMVRDFRAPESDLKKRIGIAFFENKTTFADKGLEGKFIEDLTGTIRSSCPDILLEKPGDPGYPDDLSRVPRKAFGWIDNFDLAKTGRRLGLNSIVAGTLINITPNNKKKGIWWLKDTHYYVQVQITVQVYDTETGAKLLDESFMHEIEIDEWDLESIHVDSEIKMLVLDEAFKIIADHMGEKICNAVVLQPWTGFITSIDADRIMINSGGKIGLKTGDLFEVFDSSGIFEGVGGQRFFIPGLKVGEIKITAVYPDTAEAVLVSGRDIRSGFSIRPKD